MIFLQNMCCAWFQLVAQVLILQYVLMTLTFMKTLKDGPPCMFPNMANVKNTPKRYTQNMSFLGKCSGRWFDACKHAGFAYVLKSVQNENSQGWTPL